MVRNGPPKPAIALQNFEANAPLQLKKLHVRSVRACTGLMAANSLGWMFVGSSIYIFARIFRFALLPWLEKKTVSFVENQTDAVELKVCH